MRLVSYQTARGVAPVAEYLESLDIRERATLTAAFEEISERGLDARGIGFRQIDGKLWEIRVSAHRVFYVVLRKDEMVLLHVYRKWTRKTPPREIEIARRRMREVLG